MTEAYVTLATNDGYAVGALVLAHSLKSQGTTRQLCILVTTSVSETVRSVLSNVFNHVIIVDVFDSKDSAHLSLLKRPELGVTFTKLHCWTLTQFSKCVFLDADMLAMRNPDELFQYPELSAVADIGWPDCFNSGMFVYVPSKDTYERLLQHAEVTGSFDGGDQGLLNTFFTNWNRVSFVFNMVASVTYTYLPAYKKFGKDVKLVHFLGATKPWHQRYDAQSGTVRTQSGYEQLTPYLNAWWNIYINLVRPKLPEMDLREAARQSFATAAQLTKYKDEGCMTFDSTRSNDGTSLDSGQQVKGQYSIPSPACQSPLGYSLTGKEFFIEYEIHKEDAGLKHFQIPQWLSERIGGLGLGESLLEGRARWERGQVEYTGRDSFDNIQAYIESRLKM
ncbi:glycogenin 1 isoform X3 [Oratosquilla oratoria]|uniref:glycogenin 1 isoform X2 n=1 Tax=Oratosquilla oratoria TaxID=337810 RepID=UPI003F771A7D